MSGSHFMAFQRLLCIMSYAIGLFGPNFHPIAAAANHVTLSNLTDHVALLAIKNKITHDPLEVTSSWNESIHFCQWKGVTCSLRHQRVTALDLRSQQLEGSLSPHLGNLSFLKILDLRNNSFSHEIPVEISKLFRLKGLGLANNSFGGYIPANISHCSRLEIISLERNNLQGAIPEEFGSLGHLQKLSIHSNNLTGGIPPSIGNLSSLIFLDLVYNSLDGSIPITLAKLTNLNFISVAENKLSGTIPLSIFHNLTSLETFEVAMNHFQGSLPADLGNYFPRLKAFNLHTNEFSGFIPASINNLSSLRYMIMGQNQFMGEVPSLGGLKNLEVVGIPNNNLENKDHALEFLSQLMNCSSLERLDVSNNNFDGQLPKPLGNLSTALWLMVLTRTQIGGSIPDEIGNLINLEALDLEANQFTGSIPVSIGKLQKLKELYLNQNKLSGTIPDSIGNLTLLEDLGLKFNNLQGRIPSSLGKCRELLALDLSYNQLSDPIPKEVISLSSLAKYLDLSQNQLTGSLPHEVGELRNLAYLYVSGNRLSGEIPNSLGSCAGLVGLYMDGNLFHGSIPATMSSLRGLEVLDVSRNNLTGGIPELLENLLRLKKLNLSFNDLEGEVPLKGVFANVSIVSITGNRKLCGGIPDLHLPPCMTHSVRKGKMSLKLELMISFVTVIAGLALALGFLILIRKRKSKPVLVDPSEGSMLMLSYQDILEATDRFSPTNLIGTGSFGSVYKGNLERYERVVAVKVLNLGQIGASKSFMAECKAMKNIRHRNLVKIITACSTTDFQGRDFKALIYEFMINGSLAEWLHPEENEESGQEKNLRFVERLNIAIDVASAVDYLHNHCDKPTIHCDLKPTNILLDGEMVARVSDFGLARILPEATRSVISEAQTSSVGIRGSIGYAAPEYGMGSKVSTQGDVYSYGILLLEMFTGKEPTDEMFINFLTLHNFAKNGFARVMEIVDEKILRTIEQCTIDQKNIEQCLNSVIKLGVACSVEQPNDRIGMNDVVKNLHSIKNALYWKQEA